MFLGKSPEKPAKSQKMKHYSPDQRRQHGKCPLKT
jgi:hypothetical protein